MWGRANSHEEWDSGIIAGGCDNGVIRLYNASKLAQNVDSVVAKSDRHVGSVRALNFNLFQVKFKTIFVIFKVIFVFFSVNILQHHFFRQIYLHLVHQNQKYLSGICIA